MSAPDCGQGNAVLWLSAGVGALIGTGAFLAYCFAPYVIARR